MLLLDLLNYKINEKKTTMNQNTAGALFPSFAYSQFKKEVFKQPLMLDNNFAMRKRLGLLIRKCYCLPFESYCVNPWFIGGVRVFHRYSVMCGVWFVYLRSVHCAYY